MRGVNRRPGKARERLLKAVQQILPIAFVVAVAITADQEPVCGLVGKCPLLEEFCLLRGQHETGPKPEVLGITQSLETTAQRPQGRLSAALVDGFAQVSAIVGGDLAMQATIS